MLLLLACALPARAQRAGGRPTPARIVTVAECEGPEGTFRTTAEGQRSGAMRLEQVWPDGRRSLAGVDARGAWVWSERDGRADSATAAEAFQTLAHEFHALEIWEEQRLGVPLSAREVHEGGRTIALREFARSGGRIWADRDARTGQLLRWRFEPPGGNPHQAVTVRVTARERLENRDVIRDLVLEHAGRSWRYHFTRVDLGMDAGDSLARPAPRGDREQLLALHESALRAHRRRDVDELLAPESDDYRTTRHGQWTTPTLAERRARFTRYFASASFTRYEDAAAPVAVVSRDGSLGWVIARVRAEGRATADSAGAPQPVAFGCAWTELYEKRDGRWWRTGVVSDCADD